MCAVEVCVLESFVVWVTCIHRVPNTFSDTLMVSFGQLVLKERTYAPCHATQFCTSPLSTTALLFFTVTRMIASNSMTWWQSTRTSLEEEAMDKICTYRETMCPRLWLRAAAPACFVPRLLNPAMIAEGCSSVLHRPCCWFHREIYCFIKTRQEGTKPSWRGKSTTSFSGWQARHKSSPFSGDADVMQPRLHAEHLWWEWWHRVLA